MATSTRTSNHPSGRPSRGARRRLPPRRLMGRVHHRASDRRARWKDPVDRRSRVAGRGCVGRGRSVGRRRDPHHRQCGADAGAGDREIESSVRRSRRRIWVRGAGTRTGGRVVARAGGPRRPPAWGLRRHLGGFVAPIVVDDHARLQEAVIEADRPVREFSVRYRIAHADGTIRWVETRGRRIAARRLGGRHARRDRADRSPKKRGARAKPLAGHVRRGTRGPGLRGSGPALRLDQRPAGRDRRGSRR